MRQPLYSFHPLTFLCTFLHLDFYQLLQPKKYFNHFLYQDKNFLTFIPQTDLYDDIYAYICTRHKGKSPKQKENMDKKVIELYIMNITNSQEQSGAFAILLGEIYGDRQLPIIVGAAEAQAILMELRQIKAPRPLTHDLFINTLKMLDIKFRYTLIYKVNNGVFYAYIYLQKGDEIFCIDSRTSDAIALAIRAKSAILIYDSVLEQACIHPQIMNRQLHKDINWEKLNTKNEETISASLNKLLKKAIEEEDYEMAAKLRDQIKLQKNKEITK